MKRPALTVALVLFFLPARAATIEDVKQYGKTYLADLPNIVCNYTEREFVWKGWSSFSSALKNELHDPDWKRKRWHTGELRWNRSDTRWNRKILTFNGKRTKKKLHKISNTLGNYGAGVDYSGWDWKKWKWHDKEYADDGSLLDVFEVQSARGVTVYRRLDKHRNLKRPQSVSAKGKIWAEADTGRIRKTVVEYSNDKDRSRPNSWLIFEYGYVDIDGKSYLLPKRFIFEYKSFDVGRLVTIDHYNYRRFQSKTTLMTATSKIKFGKNEIGPSTQFPSQTQEEPKSAVEESEVKEAAAPTPRKSKPPERTRPRKNRKAKEKIDRDAAGKDYLTPFQKAVSKGKDYLADVPPPPGLLSDYTPPKPKPAPKKKVVRTSTFPYGAFLNLFLIVGVIGAGMYFIRIR